MGRKSVGILLVVLALSLSLTGCLFSIPGMKTGDLRIRGTVVDEDNVGISNVAILVNSEIVGLTKSDGTWAYETAKKGAKVTAQKANWDFSPESVTVTKDEQVIWITGERHTTNVYSVSGQVVDEQGVGIPGVKITFTGDTVIETVTGPQGNFTLDNITGSGEITAAHSSYEISTSFEVNGPRTNLTFVALEVSPETYSVSGKVLSRGGLAIEGAVISIRDEVGRVQTAVSGPDGTFSKSDLVGKLAVSISLSGWDFEPQDTIVDGSTLNLNFYGTPNIETSYTASGAILTSTEEPVPAVLVKFELLDFADGEDLWTLAVGGVWQMNGLLGRVKITPQKEGYTFYPEYQIIDRANETIGFLAQ